MFWSIVIPGYKWCAACGREQPVMTLDDGCPEYLTIAEWVGDDDR